MDGAIAEAPALVDGATSNGDAPGGDRALLASRRRRAAGIAASERG